MLSVPALNAKTRAVLALAVFQTARVAQTFTALGTSPSIIAQTFAALAVAVVAAVEIASLCEWVEDK